MTYADRSDDELLALARDGVASAFAVLLYRYGPEVLAMAEQDPDPVGATVATFIRAMRDLPSADPDDLRGWLLAHAAEEIDDEVESSSRSTAVASGAAGGASDAAASAEADNRTASAEAGGGDAPQVPGGAGAGAGATTMDVEDDLDEVWVELALRWPTGRVPRHLPSWAIWLVTTLLLVGLAIALPWIVLGVSANDEQAIEELRASPVLDDLTLQEEAVEEEPEPLPTFDFPEPPDEPEPQPAPAPEPAPEPEPEPEPEPVEESDPVEDEEATEDGGTGDTTDDDTEDDGDGDGEADGGERDADDAGGDTSDEDGA